MSAADFDDLLHDLAGHTAAVDLVEALRDDVNHRTCAADAVAWLVDVIGVERFIDALVKGGHLLPVGPLTEGPLARHYFTFLDQAAATEVSEMWAGWATIVKALAACHPEDRYHSCILCGADMPTKPADHDPTCPWRMAREEVGDE